MMTKEEGEGAKNCDDEDRNNDRDEDRNEDHDTCRRDQRCQSN